VCNFVIHTYNTLIGRCVIQESDSVGVMCLRESLCYTGE
jgi:hypothetical protein